MPTPASHANVPARTAWAFAVGAILVVALLALPRAAAAAPVTFGSGQLDWGVKQSFRTYVAGPIAHGSYTAFDGAAKNPDGTVRFDVLGGPYDDATGVGELLVDGTVRFEGHDGTLDLTLRNLRVAFGGGATGTLFADIQSRENTEEGAMRQYPNTALATLTVPAATPVAGGLTWPSIAAKLTEAGAPAFGDFYGAGTDLDPLAPLTASFGTPRPRPVDRGGSGGGGAGGGGGGGAGAVAAPTVKVVGKAIAVGRRAVRIATLRCGSAACVVKAPKSVRTSRIDGRRYRVAVLAPKALKAGATGKLRVKLPKAARKALAGRRAKVSVKVEIAAGASRTTKTVKATLAGPKAPRNG